MIRCAAKVALLAVLTLPTAQPATSATYHGYAARYRPGMMQRVGRNRGMSANCMVAHTYHGLGTWVVVRGVRLGRSLRCLVVDVPAPRDRASIIRRNIIVELSHEDSRYICGSTKQPPSYCEVVTERIP